MEFVESDAGNREMLAAMRPILNVSQEHQSRSLTAITD